MCIKGGGKTLIHKMWIIFRVFFTLPLGRNWQKGVTANYDTQSVVCEMKYVFHHQGKSAKQTKELQSKMKNQIIFNRSGVAGDSLQTPLLLIDLLIDSSMEWSFGKISSKHCLSQTATTDDVFKPIPKYPSLPGNDIFHKILTSC